MADQSKNTSQEFSSAASPPTEQVLVPIDKDLVDWFRSQGDAVLRINDLCRFYRDTSVPRDWEFGEDEKMQPDPSEPPTL